MMRRKKTIAVFATDFLQGFGLKQLLEDYFSPDDFSYVINPEMHEDSLANFDLLFVHTDYYFSLYERLLPIKKKVIVLTNSQTNIPDFSMLNINDPDMLFSDVFYELCCAKLNDDAASSVGESRQELSGREKEVLTLVAKGYLNKNIADELNISINTVLTHRKNLMAKLGIKTVSGMTMYAMLNGLISADDIQ